MSRTPRLPILERLNRTVVVARTGFRVYRRYTRAQQQIAALPEAERGAAWEAVHRQSAEEIVARARRLRGLYIKAAQYLGSRADLLPEPYIAALSTLHDRVPPLSYDRIRPVLRRGLGDEPEHVFRDFERVPVAAASLAQVHRATLHDGRPVAVKVQYPDIGRLVQLDMRNLATMLRIVHRLQPNIDLRPIAEAVGRLVPQELDFINEGRGGEAIGRALAHRGDVFVPAVVWEHSSRRVLVTEYVEGTKVSDVAGLRARGLDTTRIGDQIVQVWGEQVLRGGRFHGDPHPGNLLVAEDGRLALLDFGLTASLPAEGRAGVADLCRAAAARDPRAMMAAFRRLGFLAHRDGPEAYAGLAGRLMGQRNVTSVNQRLAGALRGFDISTVPPEALLVLRVLGLLAGLSATLGRTGPVVSAWAIYAGPEPARAAV